MVANDPDQPPEQKYEKRDLSVKGVGIFVIGLVTTLVIVHFIVIGTFRYYIETEEQPESHSYVTAPPVGPAGPGLLVGAPHRLKEFRAQEEEILNNYGWMDRIDGVVRLPIDRAMDLILQRGLPVKIGANPEPPERKAP